ncbi:hypothetical protein J6590_105600 [Homalodisca vitripennis]|nr:hypothetical protein J6590_098842 [Homalodisca vitripennis]KAG8295508.1 hypothetical protein J6590_078753 [Homalodisca vitripennis]KAG8308605.1 hypothetical protein J6590_105600 [Homalodisca vitripennis]
METAVESFGVFKCFEFFSNIFKIPLIAAPRRTTEQETRREAQREDQDLQTNRSRGECTSCYSLRNVSALMVTELQHCVRANFNFMRAQFCNSTVSGSFVCLRVRENSRVGEDGLKTKVVIDAQGQALQMSIYVPFESLLNVIAG